MITQTVNVVIIDDETHCSKGLAMQLEKICPQVKIMEIFNKPLNALPYLQQNKFDILFLDIEMPLLNGFDLLKKIENPNFDIIFTTAYDQFAIKAFKYSAFDYLLKPIEDDDLRNSIKKWEKEKNNSILDLKFKNLLQQLEPQNQKKLVLPTSEGMELINIEDIVCIDSESNYSRLYFQNNTFLLISKTLKEFEDILEGKGFMRVHHSHLINLKSIQKYLKADGGYVLLSNGRKISISRARKEQILAYISNIRLQ